MDYQTLIGGILGFLVLGGLVMTQMPRHWQTTGGWLTVSLVGIPLFFMLIGLLINVPALLFGALVLTGLYAGQSKRR
ncbi:hypothetical protein [Pseudomonas sp. B392_1p]|uniref:hypothetical protein n=1 Tax=Pseudomonas sp. B392_1p TaxID=3457507 RepID=UPI003FD2DAD0